MEEPSIETCVMALISQISLEEPSETSSEADKAAFISLYYIFKDTFLFALDLLDQRRIVLYTWDQESTDSSTTSPCHIFYIYSEANEPHETPCKRYEVRTSVWYCSCPEFSFSAFNKDYDLAWKKAVNSNKYWGGSIQGKPVPICKHLLACALVEQGKTWARERITEKKISKEELVFYATQ
ncbi:hypothetical protein T552_01946 [Pneumocystis carinii B80]|uniref:SWIM-type domain-containing protein n=1 Tax=Pneumocystis carinii (strain B80) TaxID=1408658 RepID=A0A0W4ZIA6_PNEC8|nr:hypothetical protein T552_01946 [Pneumocystis carinii B80]KTW28085.1 hypothetical protein T552_01946 [Pneumocystis carinii B80]